MKNCTRCGTPNPEGQKFCGHCGQELASICINGHESPAGQRFCGECGEPLGNVSSPTATEEPGQRRLVSVLFADLVGFTTFSESRDPEEVRAMLTRYFDRSREVIEGFGGEVDKYTGDAVTAFWGAHQTQEDDAERAVRAAMELIGAVAALGDEMGIKGLQLRAGVMSGEASVGSGGNEKGLVVGDIVNVAARLQALADPGEVLVGDTTHSLTSNGVMYESAGRHELKGKSEPVHAWRALGIAGQVGGRGRVEGLEAPFVGRDNELRLLKDAVAATSRERRARLISIVGEAGIGKTRLAWELQKFTDGLTDLFLVHEGRSPSYGEGVTFWALGEMVRQRARIAENDDPLKSRTKLRTVVAEYVTDPDEQAWIEPRLAGLLGLDEMPQGDRNELFAALRTFFQRLSSSGTVLLIFEDLHWADPGLLEFITDLVEWSTKHPILVLTLARSDLLDRHPGWGSGRRHSLATHLGPLADVDMERLVQGLAPGIPRALVSMIVDRASGIPMYAVEFVRMLVGSGDLVRIGDHFELKNDVDALAIPDSLRSVIAARLDRLDHDQRSLIQNAAVLGLSFHADGLSVFGEHEDPEAALRELMRHELLEFDTDERSPERGQYRFLQSVIREVAYSRLAKAERRDRHIRVAEYYESLGDEEYTPIIASHYIDAYAADPSPEMGEVTREALQRAAERAAKLHSLDQVQALAERAIELTTRDADAAPLHQLAADAAVEQLVFDAAIEHAKKALEIYSSTGSDEQQTESAVRLAHVYIDSLHAAEASELLEPMYDEALDTPGQAKLAGALSRALMMESKYQEGLSVAERGLELAELHRDSETFADTLVTKGTLMTPAKRPQEGVLLLMAALDYAEERGLTRTAGRALNNLLVTKNADSTRDSGELAERGLRLAERQGDVNSTMRMAAERVRWLARMYRFDEAVELLEDTSAFADLEVYGPFRHLALATIGWAGSGSRPPVEDAREYLTSLSDIDDHQIRSTVYGLLAEINLLTGEYLAAIEKASKDEVRGPWTHAFEIPPMSALLSGDYESLVAIARPTTPSRRADGVNLMLDAGEAIQAGRVDEAVASFTRLIDLYDEAMTTDWRVYARLAFATTVSLDFPEALKAAEEAYGILEEAEAYHLISQWAHVLPPRSAEAAS